MHNEEVKNCVVQAYRKLSRRAMHSAELRSILQEANFSPEAIEAALQEVTRFGALNDRDFLEQLVAKYKRAGKSRLYIQSKCRNKGIELAELRPFLSDDEESLRRLIAKRYPFLLEGQVSYEKKKKALSALFRQGFSSAAISKVINSS